MRARNEWTRTLKGGRDATALLELIDWNDFDRAHLDRQLSRNKHSTRLSNAIPPASLPFHGASVPRRTRRAPQRRGTDRSRSPSPSVPLSRIRVQGSGRIVRFRCDCCWRGRQSVAPPYIRSHGYVPNSAGLLAFLLQKEAAERDAHGTARRSQCRGTRPTGQMLTKNEEREKPENDAPGRVRMPLQPTYWRARDSEKGHTLLRDEHCTLVTVPSLDSRAPVGPSAASRGGAEEGRAGTTDRSQPSLSCAAGSHLSFRRPHPFTGDFPTGAVQKRLYESQPGRARSAVVSSIQPIPSLRSRTRGCRGGTVRGRTRCP